MMTTLKAETLRALAEKATPGPWAYRPEPHDDWGVVRAGRFWICQAKDPAICTDEQLAEHRADKTDPWRGNAELVAYLRNAVPEILAMLEADKDERVAALEVENGRMREALERITTDHVGKGRTGYEAIPANHLFHADCDACHRSDIARRALGKDQAS